jgi:hypothetical protein
LKQRPDESDADFDARVARRRRLVIRSVRKLRKTLDYRDQEQSGRRTLAARTRLAEIAALGNPERCQCCGGSFVPNPSNPDGRCVDHDHESGAVRQILCPRCNMERGWIESALRSGLLERHLAVIQQHAPPMPPETRAGTRRKVRPPHPTLFDLDRDKS